MRKTSGKPTFLGTYFDRDSVLRLVSYANILAWVILVVYGIQFVLSFVIFGLQWSRGFFMGMGPTDLFQQVLYLVEQSFRGFVYFIVLQGVGKALLIFMDIEDSTRRAARQD